MPLNFDPQRLPVLGIDAHLPAVSPDKLSAHALRERFSKPRVWTPELVAERPLGARAPAHASVLVPLLEREGRRRPAARRRAG